MIVSEAGCIADRFRRRVFGHPEVEMTFNDRQMCTKRFTGKVPHVLLADSDIFEVFNENEKDSIRLPKQ